MAEIIRMPKMSDTMTEGVIARWLKKIGDQVKEGDILAEVETDKATMELEAYESGTLLYQSVPEKAAIPVNSVLAILGEPNEEITHLLENNNPKTPGPIAEFSTKTTQVFENQNINSLHPTTHQEIATKDTPAQPQQKGRIFASPLAKSMAKVKGYDLGSIQGTGEQGRIIKRDIEKIALQNPLLVNVAKQPVYEQEEAYEIVPLSAMRRITAKKLSESMSTAPHFYLTISINMDKLVAAKPSLNEYASIKITFNDLIIKSTAASLRQHPMINTAWGEDGIRYNKHIHIGVAMALPTGILVPVIRFADQKTLTQIATEVKTLQQKAQNNQLQPDDWQGSTFTISNLGMLAIESFTAIINPPASCILALGAIEKVPVVKEDDTIGIGYVMKATLSCDHRVVDGAVGAAFLKTLKTFLTEPLRLLV